MINLLFEKKIIDCVLISKYCFDISIKDTENTLGIVFLVAFTYVYFS